MNQNKSKTVVTRALTFIVTLIAALALAACAGGGGGAANKSSVLEGEDYKEAKAIFKQRCISCHASDLSGLVGDKSNLQKVGERLTAEQIAEVITNGRKVMPSFKSDFSNEQIAQLSEWLATMK